jgi:hypothetical protein
LGRAAIGAMISAFLGIALRFERTDRGIDKGLWETPANRLRPERRSGLKIDKTATENSGLSRPGLLALFNKIEQTSSDAKRQGQGQNVIFLPSVDGSLAS